MIASGESSTTARSIPRLSLSAASADLRAVTSMAITIRALRPSNSTPCETISTKMFVPSLRR